MVQHFRQGAMGTITMDEETQARKAAAAAERRAGSERRIKSTGRVRIGGVLHIVTEAHGRGARNGAPQLN